MAYLLVELAQRGILKHFTVYLDEIEKSLLVIIRKNRNSARYLMVTRINKTSFHLLYKDKHIVKRKYLDMANIIEDILKEELTKNLTKKN